MNTIVLIITICHLVLFKAKENRDWVTSVSISWFPGFFNINASVCSPGGVEYSTLRWRNLEVNWL